MGELYDELVQTGRGAAPVARPRGTHPAGWEPGVAWDGTKGTLTTQPLEDAPKDWAELLAVWGLDPALHEVVEPVGFRAWDAAIGSGQTRRMYYYRANVRLRRQGQQADVEELCRLIRRHKPPRAVPTGEQAFVVCLNDWQVGKADGDGSEGIVNRVLAAVDAVEQRVRELRKTGRSLGVLYVLGLGDMIENCADHYAQQAWRTELTLTEQVRVTRRLLVKALTRWARLFDRVVVACVPGNHGENRRGGKSFTDFSDNHDVDVFAAAKEVLDANPDCYGHVSFVFPQGQEITLTLDACGTVLGLAHGHQVKNVNRVGDWWARQAHGREPVGDADLLLTGHYHHLRVEQNQRTWIQAPALDGGSDWWRHLSGQDSPPGVLTLVVGGGRWADLAVV
jgi:predicted phosphodiesterase